MNPSSGQGINAPSNVHNFGGGEHMNSGVVGTSIN